MMNLTIIKPINIGVVSTYTYNVLRNKKIYKIKKDNIILLCGFYDTG